MDEPSSSEVPRENPVAARRASRRRLVVYGLVLLAALILVLWIFWGFRWPPTAEVASSLEALPMASDSASR